MPTAEILTILFPEQSTGSSFTTLAYSGTLIGLGKALRWDIGHWDQNVFDVGAAGATSSFTYLAHSASFKELSFSALAFSGNVSGHFASFTTLSLVGTVSGPSFTTLGFSGSISVGKASFTTLETTGNIFATASSFQAVAFSWNLTVRPPPPPDLAEEMANRIMSWQLKRRSRKFQ